MLGHPPEEHPLAARAAGHTLSEPAAAHGGPPEEGAMEPVEILKQGHRTALLVAKAARRDLKGAGETDEISAERAEQILERG
jgi:hypothetical protein